MPKVIAAKNDGAVSKRRYEFDTEQTLPISVETIASFGIAPASAASAWRGPMRPFSLGDGQCASSSIQACCSFLISARRGLLGVSLVFARKRSSKSTAASLARSEE